MLQVTTWVKYIPSEKHIVGKADTWKIERRNLNFRQSPFGVLFADNDSCEQISQCPSMISRCRRRCGSPFLPFRHSSVFVFQAQRFMRTNRIIIQSSVATQALCIHISFEKAIFLGRSTAECTHRQVSAPDIRRTFSEQFNEFFRVSVYRLKPGSEKTVFIVPFFNNPQKLPVRPRPWRFFSFRNTAIKALFSVLPKPRAARGRLSISIIVERKTARSLPFQDILFLRPRSLRLSVTDVRPRTVPS